MQADSGRPGSLAHALALLHRELFCQCDFATSDLVHRQNPLRDQALRNHRLELIKNDVDGVNLFLRVGLNDAFRDLIYRFEIHLGQQVEVFANDLHPPGASWLCDFADRIPASQKIAPFSADGQNVDVLFGKDLQKLRR